jgi:hypothetical protein
LFISGSIGLGHVWRDMAIARELRRINPTVEIQWVSEYPAIDVLKRYGEKVLPDVEKTINTGKTVDELTTGYETNIIDFSMKWLKVFPVNAQVYLDAIKREGFDLVVGDESYEMIITLLDHPEKKTFPFVLIYDFVGHKAMTMRPKEHLEG